MSTDDKGMELAKSLRDEAHRVWQDKKDPDSADQLLRAALILLGDNATADRNWLVALLKETLGLIYREQKRYQEAESLFRENLFFLQWYWGKNNSQFARFVNNVGCIRHDLKSFQESADYFKAAIESLDKLPGEHASDLRRYLTNYALALRQLGRGTEAEVIEKRASEIIVPQEES